MWKTYSSIMDIQFNSQLSSKDNGTKEKRARFFKIVGALLFLSDTTINGLALSVILSNVSGIMFPYYQFTFSAWNTVSSQLVWAIVMKGVKKEKHTQDSEMGLIKRGKSRRQKEIEQRPRRGMCPGSILSHFIVCTVFSPYPLQMYSFFSRMEIIYFQTKGWDWCSLNVRLDDDLYKVDTDPSFSRNMILVNRKVGKNATTMKKKIKLIFEKSFSVHWV